MVTEMIKKTLLRIVTHREFTCTGQVQQNEWKIDILLNLIFWFLLHAFQWTTVLRQRFYLAVMLQALLVA